jgi:TRAP-type C4-dicarboxylate transport system substrate-binding protein
VLDKHLAKPFDDLLAARGLRLLGFGEVGAIDLVGKKAFANPADVKGIKAIAYTKIQAIAWTALGANSTFVGVPEWSSALQTGLVDAVGAPMALYVPSGLNKVAPVLTRLYLWHTPALTLINRALWDRLSPAQRDGMTKVAQEENAAVLRAEIRAVEQKLREAHAGGGGQIVEITPEQRAAWRAAVAPAWPEMVKAIGGQAETLYKAMEAARASCRG